MSEKYPAATGAEPMPDDGASMGPCSRKPGDPLCSALAPCGPVLALLKDPRAVWTNMLRGTIAMPTACEANNGLVEMVESLARQHCFTHSTPKKFQGVEEVNVTDSGAITSDAEALRMLSEFGRFRILRSGGRMVVGYWPEHDPLLKSKKQKAARPPQQTSYGGRKT
jgi:hypothetical protein